MMSYEAFRKVARRGGFIRWTISGIVERIESGEGGFWAINPASGRRHQVFNRHPQTGKIRQIWHCEEVVEFDEFDVSLGDLADALYQGKSLVIHRRERSKR